MPVITLNSVVLPAPFGPMIALRSPAMIWRVTSRTACKPSNLLPRPFNSRTGTLPFARLLVFTLVVLWFKKVAGVRCANPGDFFKPEDNEREHQQPREWQRTRSRVERSRQ